jgi:hypothetical protein
MQLRNISEQLLLAAEKLRLFKKAERRLEYIKKRLEEERQREIELAERLRKEKKDYDRMNRSSLQYLFYSVFQSAEKKKEKELNDYLLAELKWQQCIDELAKLDAHYRHWVNKRSEVQSAAIEYNDLFSQKESLLLALDSGKSVELNRLGSILTEKNHSLKELKEVVSAGEELLFSLTKTLNHLGSASGLGTWDLLGGGMIVTAMKRSAMDDAKDEMQNAQHLLNRFNNEIGDTGEAIQTLGIGGVSGFADYFFDGLIADWMVQSGISQSQKIVSELKDKVLGAVEIMKRKVSQQGKEVSVIQQSYNLLVEAE